ncbi:hypothetical protein [Burkholderia ubonensis]|nr:hypothetical protein [Burkholderia ubonensis]
MDKVWVLRDADERVVAIHRTKEGADAHRARFVMPSWIEIEEWELED